MRPELLNEIAGHHEEEARRWDRMAGECTGSGHDVCLVEGKRHTNYAAQLRELAAAMAELAPAPEY